LEITILVLVAFICNSIWQLLVKFKFFLSTLPGVCLQNKSRVILSEGRANNSFAQSLLAGSYLSQSCSPQDGLCILGGLAHDLCDCLSLCSLPITCIQRPLFCIGTMPAMPPSYGVSCLHLPSWRQPWLASSSSCLLEGLTSARPILTPLQIYCFYTLSPRTAFHKLLLLSFSTYNLLEVA
jgi:hypothetical protein